MSGLSDDDLREAAAEAGISPAELRDALGEQDKALMRAPQSGSALAAQLPRGSVVLSARANIPQPPPEAVRNVRAHIETQIGQRGHMHGATEAGIYDEEHGIIYRVRADEDGQGGALVQVDIDDAPNRGKATLAKIALGATLAVFGLGGLLFGSFIMLGITAGIGALGVGALTVNARSKAGLANQAHAIASHALIEAEERAPGPQALPPA